MSKERSMSAWVGVAPLIGAGSLDWFAIGALASGACFLAITASRRARKRHALALSDGPALGPRPHQAWLCEHVLAAEAFPADAERLAQPDMLDLQHPDQEGGPGETGHAGQDLGRMLRAGRVFGAGRIFRAGRGGRAGRMFRAGRDGRAGLMFRAGRGGRAGLMFRAGRDGRTAGTYRSRHRRLGDPIPGRASPGREFAGRADAEREVARPGDLLPPGTSRHAAFPDSALHGGASQDGAHRLPELAFPDDTCRDSRRSDARRLPRHAAPGASLNRRLRMSTLTTSLTATRALIGGAHG
jgi:hypothetical protein